MLKVMKQYSVYLPNKPGELKRLLHKVKKLDLAAAATFASQDGAIMRLVPQDAGSFNSILKQNNIAATKQDVLMVGVPNQPGGLLRILSKLQQAHVNIEGLYIVGNDGVATAVIQAKDANAAKAALE